ncbi:HD domain-containing phosphohydrolase [Bdellovibrionota bacterium FG-1]
MLRSKRIEDYIEAPLDTFKPDQSIPVDIHLFFARNRSILIWCKTGETISSDQLAQQHTRGIHRAWIHRDDIIAWHRYLGAESHPARVPPTLRTEEAIALQEVLSHPTLEDRTKNALTASAARDVLNSSATAETDQGVLYARLFVRDILDIVLDSATEQTRSLTNELWTLGTAHPKMDHALNVATFAVLFAMASGRSDEPLLVDVALASLLHDIGLTQLSTQITTQPQTHHLYQHRQKYALHVDEGIRLINTHVRGMPPRVKSLISQHHEKVDGTGYPRSLVDRQIDETAQYLILADLLESVASGRWDGTIRSLKEALTAIETLQSERAAPEYVRPGLLYAVTRWIRDGLGAKSPHETAQRLRNQADALLARHAS